MKKILFLPLLLLLISPFTYSQGQQSAIKGTIVSSDGKAVADISIRIEGTPHGVVSDANGVFQFKKLKPGKYLLKMSAVGIEAQEQTVNVAAGETTTVSFTIHETAAELGQVIVNADRNKYTHRSSDQAARMPLKNLENPQVYTTISAELIKDQVLVDYRDAFRNVPGVNSLEQLSNGRTSAYIRGFRTGNFMRNGTVTQQLTATEVANLERIEVLKGPSGTLFGSAAISYGGVVNRVTKKPLDVAQTEISYTGGSYALSRLAADINAPLNKEKTALLRLNVVRHTTGSFQETGFQRNYFIAPSFSYKVNDKLTLTTDMELYSNAGTNTGIGFYASPAATPGITSYEGLNKIYSRTFASDDITSNLKGYTFFARGEYKINDNWSFNALYNYAGVDARDQLQFTPGLFKGDSITRQIQRYSHNYYNQNGQVNLTGDVNIGGIRNRILIGADLTQVVTNPTYLKNFMFDTVSMTGPVTYIMRDKIEQRLAQLPYQRAYKDRSYYLGAYVSDVINITQDLMVMGSIRYDKVDVKGTTSMIDGKTTGTYTKSTFSPKAGIVYQLLRDQVSLFANYLNGFQYSTSVDKNGNLFQPERANQYEGGVKTDLLDGKLSATASYYHINVSNKLRLDPSDATNSTQIQDGTQLSEGTEVEINSRPVSGLNIIAGYAYNNSKYTKTNANILGKTPGKVAKNMANAWISYTLPKTKLKGLGLGAGMNYSSQSFYDDNNNFILPEYIVISSVLSYDLPKWRLAVRGDNLGNRKYWGPWGNAQPLRNFSASVSFKF